MWVAEKDGRLLLNRDIERSQLWRGDDYKEIMKYANVNHFFSQNVPLINRGSGSSLKCIHQLYVHAWPYKGWGEKYVILQWNCLVNRLTNLPSTCTWFPHKHQYSSWVEQEWFHWLARSTLPHWWPPSVTIQQSALLPSVWFLTFPLDGSTA